MRYQSTRGAAEELSFREVMLTGLARDGGLYVPARWPGPEGLGVEAGPQGLAGLSGLDYAEAAIRVMRPFVAGEVPEAAFPALVRDAYAGFAHAAVAPLVQVGPGDWVLELFHGPTLAFKDFALQVLGRLMDQALAASGRRATVVGATSGDTGSAAIEAFRGRDAIDIFILHPHGRTSAVQRKQMTGVADANVHNIALEGSFDDCQALVKALFNDLPRRDRLQLAGVNSINWARIMAQIVYYLTAAAALGAPARGPVAFSVPTGNFGDVFAGYAARRMAGAEAIDPLIIATNVNDILVRTLATGHYEPRGVAPTQSPSMDIQISSNFERMLFEVAGRDAARVRAHIEGLRQSGGFELSDAERRGLSEIFGAERVGEAETTAAMAEVYRGSGYLLDPHSAVGYAAARRRRTPAERPCVTLATAHPAKFPEAVRRAIGRDPEVPERLARVLDAEERFTVLANDYATVARFIDERARAGRSRL